MTMRVCPDCGASLDPGERCDCKENAASGGNDTESGKGKWNTSILGEKEGNVNG